MDRMNPRGQWQPCAHTRQYCGFFQLPVVKGDLKAFNEKSPTKGNAYALNWQASQTIQWDHTLPLHPSWDLNYPEDPYMRCLPIYHLVAILDIKSAVIASQHLVSLIKAAKAKKYQFRYKNLMCFFPIQKTKDFNWVGGIIAQLTTCETLKKQNFALVLPACQTAKVWPPGAVRAQLTWKGC